jgi:hypothetical protein
VVKKANHAVGVVVGGLVGLELVHTSVAFLAHFACEIAISHAVDSVWQNISPGPSYRRKTFARLLRSPLTLVAVCYRAAIASAIRS